MREIKFRAWHKEKEEMIYDNFSVSYNGIPHDPFGFQPLEIMQYTGLKDKNGVEIYEGDILSRTVYKDWKSCDVVFFSEKEARYKLLHNNEIGKEKYFVEDIGEFEVIGNIYENPELLENNK